MTIYMGSNKIVDVCLGNTELEKVMIGQYQVHLKRSAYELLKSTTAWWNIEAYYGQQFIPNSSVVGGDIGALYELSAPNGLPVFNTDHFVFTASEHKYLQCPGIPNSTVNYMFGIFIEVDTIQPAQEIAGNPTDFWIVFKTNNQLEMSIYGNQTIVTPDIPFVSSNIRLVGLISDHNRLRSFIVDAGSLQYGTEIAGSHVFNASAFNIGVQYPGRSGPRYSSFRFYGGFFNIGTITDAKLARIGTYYN